MSSSSTWECPKCFKRNGVFDKKCWNCGHKQPPGMAPTPEQVAEQKQFEEARKAEERERMARLRGRPVGAVIGGLLGVALAEGSWVYFMIKQDAPIFVFAVIIVIFQGAIIGTGVWVSGRGYRIGYGLLGAALGFLGSVIAQQMIYAYYLGAGLGADPMAYMLSGDPQVYLQAFAYGFHPLDLLQYFGVAIIAGWLSWRSEEGESRLASLLDGLGTRR